MSVDVVKEDEDRRVYTEVTNRLRSKCVVEVRFISFTAQWKKSKHVEVDKCVAVLLTNVINLAPISLRLGAVCSKQ